MSRAELLSQSTPAESFCYASLAFKGLASSSADRHILHRCEYGNFSQIDAAHAGTCEACGFRSSAPTSSPLLFTFWPVVKAAFASLVPLDAVLTAGMCWAYWARGTAGAIQRVVAVADSRALRRKCKLSTNALRLPLHPAPGNARAHPTTQMPYRPSAHCCGGNVPGQGRQWPQQGNPAG